MKKFAVLFFSISLIGLSYYGLHSNIYYIQMLMNLGEPYMFSRTALIMALAAYAFIPGVRLHSTKALLGFGGMALLSLGLVSVCSPTLLGQTNNYVLIGDAISLIEGGILAIILSAELPARKTIFMATSFYFIQSLFASKLKLQTYYPLLATAANTQEATLISHMVGGYILDGEILEPKLKLNALKA